MTFNSLSDFTTYLVGDPSATEERLSHSVYKNTNCGAWLKVIEPGMVTKRVLDFKAYFTFRKTEAGYLLVDAYLYETLPAGIVRPQVDGILDVPVFALDVNGLDAWVIDAAQVDPETKIANEWCVELLDTMHECDGVIPWIGELGGFEIPTGRNHVGGILVGSIVEGSDAEVTADPLMFPFTEKDWDTTIEWVEGEVDFLWHEANDDEDVGGEE